MPNAGDDGLHIRTDDHVHALVMSALVEAQAAECADIAGTLEVLMQAVRTRALARHITVAATFDGNTLTFERITVH